MWYKKEILVAAIVCGGKDSLSARIQCNNLVRVITFFGFRTAQVQVVTKNNFIIKLSFCFCHLCDWELLDAFSVESEKKYLEICASGEIIYLSVVSRTRTQTRNTTYTAP